MAFTLATRRVSAIRELRGGGLNWDEEQERLILEARLLASSPVAVFEELKKLSAKIRAQPLWTGDDKYEVSLINRNDRLINLGLATYGTNKEVLKALYKHGLPVAGGAAGGGGWYGDAPYSNGWYGRSLQDLVSFLSELHALNIDLFLHQQGLDTTTPAGKAMFQMMGVFAEFERAMIAERVRAGLRRAKDEGKQLGRPRIAPELEKRILAALNERKRTGEGVRGIAKRFGVDPSTVQRISRPFDGVVA
jgi:hypothetical protein